MKGRIPFEYPLRDADRYDLQEVVDDGQFLTLQQQDVGAAQFVWRATGLQLLLDVAHRVVAKVARQAAAKTR